MDDREDAIDHAAVDAQEAREAAMGKAAARADYVTVWPLTAEQRLQQAMAAVAAKFGSAAAEMLRQHVEADRKAEQDAKRRR